MRVPPIGRLSMGKIPLMDGKNQKQTECLPKILNLCLTIDPFQLHLKFYSLIGS